MLHELDEMNGRNEIHLPYKYTVEYSVRGSFSGGKLKRKEKRLLSREERAKKEEFERNVAQRIALAQGASGRAFIEPNPRNFRTRSGFIKACVSYKMRFVDDSIREQYKRRIGGMKDYQYDMQREAADLWRSVHSR